MKNSNLPKEFSKKFINTLNQKTSKECYQKTKNMITFVKLKENYLVIHPIAKEEFKSAASN
jgi:hypothetical protein